MFENRLKQLRIQKGINMKQAALLLNMPYTTYVSYEKNEREPNSEALVQIANFFDCSVDYLVGRSAQVKMQICKDPEDLMQAQLLTNSDIINFLPTSNYFVRPLFNSVAAGLGAPAENTIVDYIPTFIPNASEKDKYIWVNVQGDSMSPLIDDGSQILIRLQNSVDSGQIAVVLIDNEEAVVKRVKYDQNSITLISVNPYYPKRQFNGTETERLRIVGVVKKVSKDL